MTDLRQQLAQITLCGALLFMFCQTTALAESNTAPRLPKGLGEQCVKPVDEMRRSHMDMLKHQRDDTMHRGVRPKAGGSLKACLECHTQKDGQGKYIPVNAPDQFCSVCHQYAAVSIDCFQCHATKPEQK